MLQKRETLTATGKYQLQLQSLAELPPVPQSQIVNNNLEESEKSELNDPGQQLSVEIVVSLSLSPPHLLALRFISTL